MVGRRKKPASISAAPSRDTDSAFTSRNSSSPPAMHIATRSMTSAAGTGSSSARSSAGTPAQQRTGSPPDPDFGDAAAQQGELQFTGLDAAHALIALSRGEQGQAQSGAATNTSQPIKQQGQPVDHGHEAKVDSDEASVDSSVPGQGSVPSAGAADQAATSNRQSRAYKKMTFQHHAANSPPLTTALVSATPTSGFVNMGVGTSGPARLVDLASTLPGAQPPTLNVPRATGRGPKAKWQKVAIPIPPEVQECYDQLQIQLQNGSAPQVPTNGVFRSSSDPPPIPGSKEGYFLLQKQPHYKLKEPQEFVCFWYASAKRPGIQCHRYKTGRGDEVDWDSLKQIKLLNRYVTQEMQRAGCAKLRDDMSKRAWIEEEQQWIKVHVKQVLDSWPADVKKSRNQLAEKLALLLNQQFQGKSMVGTVRGQKQKQASVRPERTASALESECERLRIFKEYGVGGLRSKGSGSGEDDEGDGQVEQEVEEEVRGEDEQAEDSREEMESE